MHFTEETLERAVIELFEAEQILHYQGESQFLSSFLVNKLDILLSLQLRYKV